MTTRQAMGQPIRLIYHFSSITMFLQKLLSSPRLVALGIFSLAYLIAVLHFRRASANDPTSFFFDPAHGYDKRYSLVREQQAAEFIAAASADGFPAHPPLNPTPSLCLGVATVARPQEQYIRATVGSLLEGLTPEARAALHFVFFIAHSDPSAHPIHGERWVDTLPDTLLTYPNNATLLAQIAAWELARDYKPKGLYDYAYLLQACHATRAPYVAMIEGDVLAVSNWLPRALAAVRTVDANAVSSSDEARWLYLRLFHTEAFLGWNREEWPVYLGSALLGLAVLAVALVAARSQSRRLQQILSNTTLAAVLLGAYPACVALYFLAGRVTVAGASAGVRRMDRFGCCSQGFVFAREIVPLLVQRIEHHSMEFIDMLLEAVADGEAMQRWAIFPSLLQHIGGTSSKGDEVADSRARMIWNFGFEMYNAAAIRAGI